MHVGHDYIIATGNQADLPGYFHPHIDRSPHTMGSLTEDSEPQLALQVA